MVAKGPNNASIVLQYLPLQKSLHHFSFVDFIKRPCVRKAAVPDLIHHSSSLNIILTVRSVRHRYRGPAFHALLMLIHDLPLGPMPELPPEPTLAAQ